MWIIKSLFLSNLVFFGQISIVMIEKVNLKPSAGYRGLSCEQCTTGHYRDLRDRWGFWWCFVCVLGEERPCWSSTCPWFNMLFVQYDSPVSLQKKRFYKLHILQNFHWAGRRVPLEGAFPAPVMATRRVANRLIFLIKPEVTTIDICHQAASGVGVECFCRPGWVGSDCGQRGRCG